ncbi:MAG TPA: HD domain-containing phosphohydrolase [Terriglobales bacterium]|nr:HD domain-containing phosphohydrolase [Terriglobales bacterium]
MSEKILFVDDEPAVLDGYRRLLHRDFDLDTAVGGKNGLAAIASNAEGGYAVVVSDIRMPEMDGVQFLSRVRTVSPDSVRMALTGYADIQAAMDAVNEGSIFRFLTKPCDKQVLANALTTGVLQHRLVIAEKELLEKTLSGSIKVLTDVLSLVNPAAFSRAVRTRRYVSHVIHKLKLEGGWQFEVAAMMSHLGCVTLDTTTIDAVYAGRKLSPEEEARFDAHPVVAGELLSKIPRLEPVARMIMQQNSVQASGVSGPVSRLDVVALGAQILKVTLAYDQLLNSGKSAHDAIAHLLSKPREFEAAIVNTLLDMESQPQHMEVRSCRIADLNSDMVLQEDVRTKSGVLVVAKGQQITYPLLVRLRNFWESRAIPGSILVHMPGGEATDSPASAASQSAGAGR